MHCTILEVSMLIDSKNYTEVFPNSDPICVPRKITHQASLWYTRKSELHCDPRLHYSQKLRKSFQATCPALSVKLRSHVNQACAAYHYTVPRNCAYLIGRAPCWLALLSLGKLRSFDYLFPRCPALHSSRKLRSNFLSDTVSQKCPVMTSNSPQLDLALL